MSNWKECKLGSVAEVQTGPFGSQLHMSDYKSMGTPIITVEHLGENRIIHSNLPLVGDDDRERLIKYTLNVGDIVFSRVGSVDRRAFVTEKENGWMFSGRCLRVRPNIIYVNPRFLSYYFGQEDFKENIRRIAVGATMPSINTTILSEIDIYIPSLPEQKAIAEVLSCLDDKIELLHRQNKTLEAMAEALFRQWFIEPCKDGLPDGWEEGKLGDIVEFNYGIALKQEKRTGKDYPVVGSSGIVGFHNEFFVKSPGIVTGRKGTLGVINFIFENFTPIDTTFYITSRIGSKLLLFEYFLLRTCDLGNMNSDSAVPGLNRNAAHSIPITIPHRKCVDLFNDTVKPFFEKLKSNQHQICTLEKLRDSLLPKLMSGEVRVVG